MNSNSKILLSIAIPTWNRAGSLDNALGFLYKQAIDYKDLIEIIISDNNSTDNTQNIISIWKNKFRDFRCINIKQSINLGFYGNFKTCREISKGKYLWLLSDDDYLNEGVLKEIISVLQSNPHTCCIYLENESIVDKYYSVNTTMENLFVKYNRKLTFISALIFKNVKQNDNFLFNKFKNSNLIGFILVVELYKFECKDSNIIYGKSLDCGKEPPKGYNWFEAFLLNISEILDYMLIIGYSNKIVKKIENSLIKDSFAKRLFYLKAHKKLDGGLDTFPLKKIYSLLFVRFYKRLLFWLILFPIIITPSKLISLMFPAVERIRTKIRRHG